MDVVVAPPPPPAAAAAAIEVLLLLGGDVAGITVDVSAVLLVAFDAAVDADADEDDVGEPTVDEAADDTADSCSDPIPFWLLPLLLLSITDDSLLSTSTPFAVLVAVFITSWAISAVGHYDDLADAFS